jgi:hypothetical protein
MRKRRGFIKRKRDVYNQIRLYTFTIKYVFIHSQLCDAVTKGGERKLHTGPKHTTIPLCDLA